MKRPLIVGIAGVTAAAIALSLSGPATAHTSSKAHLAAVGLTAGHKLVTFSVDKSSKATTYAAVTGLQGDTRLVGIDYRVQDGKLYGVGDNGGVYTLNPSTGAATKVSQLSMTLQGTAFGVDFNPAADRLRIVSNTGQNLRHDVNAGGTTLSDTPLTYPPATTTATTVTAAAYTNNDPDTETATTLYDIDTGMDQVALQSPANSGQLSAVGKLGVDATGDAGFDIHTSMHDGKATGATGYAVLTVGARTAVYRICLFTGRADRLRTLPATWQVTDLAVHLQKS